MVCVWVGEGGGVERWGLVVVKSALCLLVGRLSSNFVVFSPTEKVPQDCHHLLFVFSTQTHHLSLCFPPYRMSHKTHHLLLCFLHRGCSTRNHCSGRPGCRGLRVGMCSRHPASPAHTPHVGGSGERRQDQPQAGAHWTGVSDAPNYTELS